MNAPLTASLARKSSVPIPSALVVMVVGALLLGLAARMVVGHSLPLWLDETFTGAIAGQPTLLATIQQALLDPNAPAYYLLMHFWTSAFGLSDGVLRFPSLISGIIAPLIAL